MIIGPLASAATLGNTLPWDETARLAALRSYGILDTPRESDFDDIATLAAALLGAPIGVVNLIETGRQWFKAEVGIGVRELPLDVSLCAHAILGEGMMIVPDTRLDARFACNPLVTADNGLRFYAGALLKTPDGLPIGTLCVLDHSPRPAGITDTQRATLEVLARQVMTLLALRRAVALDAERAVDLLRNRVWQVTTDLLAVLETDGTIEAVNPAWTALLGWTDADLKGKSLAHCLHPDDVALVARVLPLADHDGEPIRFESRHRHVGGDYRWLAWVVVPEAGKLYCSARDITAEKEQAAALEETEAALRQAQKMEAVGQLTGGLAHDFNNLLAGISGSLELSRVRLAQGRASDVDKYLGAAMGATKRAAALTHRLLAFSRRQTLAPRPTDVNKLVSGMEELIGRTAGPAISVETVGAAGLWSTLVDASQLENALLNLCINARDAMPDGGKLIIETGNRWIDARIGRDRDIPPGQYVSLCVSDNGTGMTRDVVARAFDPFFTTKPLGAGTGLGLSMIYGFARQSGGQVRIYSEEGQGTMVCIYLPRHLGPAEELEGAADTTQVTPTTPGQTALVVDDDALVRMLVVDVLEEMGYTALEADDGPAALKVLESEARIDLLVTDVGLPNGLNGRQVADAARLARPDLKVLFITGYAENAVLSHGHLEPGMHILTKPFPIEALVTQVTELAAQ